MCFSETYLDNEELEYKFNCVENIVVKFSDTVESFLKESSRKSSPFIKITE